MATASEPLVIATPPRSPRTAPNPADAIDLDALDDEFPDLDGIALDGATVSLPDARTLSVLRSTLERCELDLSPETTIDAQDARLVDMDLTGRRIDGLVRVRFEGCRLGGADLGDARLHDVAFVDCVLELASLRKAELERVVIDGGRTDGLDLTGARLQHVTVTGASLTGVTLDRVRSDHVDLTGADLSGVVEVAALAGCTIDEPQSIALAARLARAVGVKVVRLEG